MKNIQLNPILLGLLLGWIPLSFILVWSIFPSITINIIIFLILIFWIPLSFFLIWNGIKKLDVLEQWIQLYITKIMQVQSDLKEVDSTGVFESDDEIGVVFKEIKEIINSLDEVVETVNRGEHGKSKKK